MGAQYQSSENNFNHHLLSASLGFTCFIAEGQKKARESAASALHSQNRASGLATATKRINRLMLGSDFQASKYPSLT